MECWASLRLVSYFYISSGFLRVLPKQPLLDFPCKLTVVRQMCQGSREPCWFKICSPCVCFRSLELSGKPFSWGIRSVKWHRDTQLMLRGSTSLGWTNCIAKTKMNEWGKQVASAHDTEQQFCSQGLSGLVPPRSACQGEPFHHHGVKEVP